jgi:hypothetical protein
MDSLWSLTRILQSLGWELPTDNLCWRGQLVRAMEEAGIGLGDDNVIRVRLPENRPWQPASGPAVKTLLKCLPQHSHPRYPQAAEKCLLALSTTSLKILSQAIDNQVNILIKAFLLILRYRRALRSEGVFLIEGFLEDGSAKLRDLIEVACGLPISSSEWRPCK